MATTRDVSSWLPGLTGPFDLQSNGGSIVPRRSQINFVGCRVTDDPLNDRTDIETVEGSAVFTVGPAGSPAQYRCSGTADQVIINQAIAACNAAGGGIVQLLPGTYTVTAPVLMKSKIWLRGSGAGATQLRISSSWDASNLANAGLVVCMGADQSPTVVTSDVALGDNVINITPGSVYNAIANGDFCVLISEEIFEPETATSLRKTGEFVKVLTKSASSFTVQGIARSNYRVSDGAQVRKINFMTDVKVSDIEFTQTGGKNTFVALGACVLFQMVKGAVVSNCKMHDWDGQGVGVLHSINVRVDGNYIHNLTDYNTTIGYGVVVGGASEQVSVVNNNISHCRHGYSNAAPRGISTFVSGTYGIVRNVVVASNTVMHCTSSGIDTHLWCEDIVITGNAINNCLTWAVFTRGRGTHVMNNAIAFCGAGINTGIGKTASGGSGTGSMVCGNTIRQIKAFSTITDNGTVISSGDAIQLLLTDNVIVAGNHIEGCDNSGINMRAWAKRCIIRDNTIINANLLNGATASAITLTEGFNQVGTITKSGTTCTWAYAGALLGEETNDYVAGETVIISGSSTPANNGTFVITGVNYTGGISSLTYQNASGAADAGSVTAKIENVTDCWFVRNIAINAPASSFDVPGMVGQAKYLVYDASTSTGVGGNARNFFKDNTALGTFTGLFNFQNTTSFYAGNGTTEATPVKTTAGTPTDAAFSATPSAGVLAVDTTNNAVYFRDNAAWRKAIGSGTAAWTWDTGLTPSIGQADNPSGAGSTLTVAAQSSSLAAGTAGNLLLIGGLATGGGASIGGNVNLQPGSAASAGRIGFMDPTSGVRALSLQPLATGVVTFIAASTTTGFSFSSSLTAESRNGGTFTAAGQSVSADGFIAGSMSLLGGNATGTTGTGGSITLQPGTGNTANGSVTCRISNVVALTILPVPTGITQIVFAATVTAAKINQSILSSGTPAPMTIQAQSVTTGTGAPLVLTGGTGSVAYGQVTLSSSLNVGTVTQAMADLPQTISPANSVANIIITTGSNSAVRALTISVAPTAGILKFVRNSCTTNGITVQFLTGTATATIPPNTSAVISADGTNAIIIVSGT